MDVDVFLEFVAGVARAHNLYQLLLDDPSSVPLHVQLSGELAGGGVVLGARNKVDGQVEDRADPRRG